MTKKKFPALSPTEDEIFRTVCQLEKAAVHDVFDNFPKKRKIRYTTVQTLLRRLETKGYLKHRVQGNAHVYYAAVNMESLMKSTINDFIEKVFGGDPVPLMMYLAKHGKVTTQDLKKLIKLAEEE